MTMSKQKNKLLTVIRLPFVLIHRLFKKTNSHGNILVIQPFPGIGDVIWFLPHMHALADAKGPITLMTKPRSFADKLLATDPRIKNIIWLERNPGRHDGIGGFFRLLADLGGHAFSEAWLFHSSSRYAWALYFSGIPVTYGFGKKAQKRLLTQTCFLSKSELKKHSIEKSNRLLEYAGIPFKNREPDFYIEDKVVENIKRQYKLENNQQLTVAFAIGSSNPLKHWGARHFVNLARQLPDKGFEKIFLLGGPADQGLADEMISGFNSNNGEIIKIISMPFEQVAGLIKCTRFCVGNDTGILNIAAAVKTPAVGLFAVTQPLTNSSYMIAIIPETINKQGNGEMNDISVNQVMTLIHKLKL